MTNEEGGPMWPRALRAVSIATATIALIGTASVGSVASAAVIGPSVPWGPITVDWRDFDRGRVSGTAYNEDNARFLIEYHYEDLKGDGNPIYVRVRTAYWGKCDYASFDKWCYGGWVRYNNRPQNTSGDSYIDEIPLASNSNKMRAEIEVCVDLGWKEDDCSSSAIADINY